MPVPFSPLNLATASSSAFCCGPESACHSMTSTGPVMSRSASVDCWGAGAAALHAAVTSMTVARIVAFNRIRFPSSVGGLGPPAPTVAGLGPRPPTISYYAAPSTPDARAGDTVNEIPLRHEVEDHYRRDDERRRGHEQIVVGARFLPERVEADLHRPHLGMVRHDERPEERVPAPEEAHERHRDERGDRDRQNDAPEETEVPRTVDPRCVRELSRHREEELPEEEDREGGREKAQDLHLIRG